MDKYGNRRATIEL